MQNRRNKDKLKIAENAKKTVKIRKYKKATD
jgi:hypothetical protein